MKSLKEQISCKCVHFNGMMNKTCDAGIAYDDIKNKDARPFEFPCLQQGGFCEKSTFLTEDQIDERLKEIDDSCTNSLLALVQIKEAIKKSGKISGVIECPACKGEMRYTQAQVNGHVWAACKCGIRFNE